MIEISLVSVVYCLVVFMVCLLVLVFYFCEFGGSFDEMIIDFSFKGSVLIILILFEGYKLKLLSWCELFWFFYVIFRNYKFRIVIGNVRLKKEFILNCFLEVMDGNDLEIS